MIKPLKSVAACAAAVGIATIGMTPMMAASGKSAARRMPSFELLGPRVERPSAESAGGPKLPDAALAKATVTPAEAREILQKIQSRPGPGSSLAESLIRLLEIAETRDLAKKHALIQKLGVEVRKQVSEEGVTSTFVVRGRERARMFRPTPNPTRGLSAGSPLVMPDTANPIVNIANDCVPEEVAPEECATEQEIEDFGSWLADVDAEALAGMDEASNYTSGDQELISGPADRDAFNCVSEALLMMAGWSGVHWAVASEGGVIFSAQVVTRAMLIDAGIAVGGTIAGAIAVTYILYKCCAERNTDLSASLYVRRSMRAAQR